MEKISVNIEGTSEEIAKAIKALAALLSEPEEKQESQEEDWSEDEIKKFWQMLTEGAREVLRVIAKHPAGCDRDVVLKDLGLNGNQLAGRLSSQGHTMRQFPKKPRPVELDWNTWEYKMRPEFVEAIKKFAL